MFLDRGWGSGVEGGGLGAGIEKLTVQGVQREQRQASSMYLCLEGLGLGRGPMVSHRLAFFYLHIEKTLSHKVVSVGLKPRN